MDVPSLLMSRAGFAAMRLAQRLAPSSAGERIPKFEDLARDLECGKGTIQAGFDLLADTGGLTLKSRGRLGTFIDTIDHAVLWQIAGQRSISVAMPLPYSRRYEGLATGLQASFIDSGINLSLMFMRGSVARLGALAEGRTDFVVLSSLAAGSHAEVEVVHNYGPGTYVQSHCVVLAQDAERDSPDLRIGVDPASADQERLVEHAFGTIPASRRVAVSYNQLDAAFAEGLIDATVWNADEISAHISAPIRTEPVQMPADAANTQAVVVRQRTSQPMAVGVQNALTSPTVTTRANDVIAGRRTPTY